MKKGFTLVELLIVIMVVTILSLFYFQFYNGYKTSAQTSACVQKHQTITKWFEVEMMQCRLGIQPHAEPGRGDQTYDFPDYGYVKNDPRYPSCRGNIKHHAEGIGQGWGYRYMNPYKSTGCNTNKQNCHPYKGVWYSEEEPELGDMHTWGYYEVLDETNENTRSATTQVNVHITFTSLCEDKTYKRDIITSHVYTINSSEFDKLENINNNSNDFSESEDLNRSDNNEGYLSTNDVY